VSSNNRPSLLDEPTWSRFYRSTDRRAIETLLIGSGRRRVAILASLHGDETQSVALVEELARYLRVHPEMVRSTTVLLVRCPNPDGLAGRTPYNMHGTDLNRNFPAPNWQDLNTVRSGAKPASEAETRVMMRLLSDFQPTLIVHLKDSRNDAVVNFEGNVQSQAEQVARIVNGQVVQGLGEKTTGSLESYALNKLKCPSLTVLLAREASDQQAWAKNRDAFLAVLGSGGPGEQSAPRDEESHPFDQPSMRQSSMNGKGPAGAVRGQSPDGPTATTTKARRPVSRTPLPDYPSAVPDHGYVELPPP
jgi:predicted deacylase